MGIGEAKALVVASLARVDTEIAKRTRPARLADAALFSHRPQPIDTDIDVERGAVRAKPHGVTVAACEYALRS